MSFAAAMKIVAGQLVGSLEGGDALAEGALLVFDLLSLGFAGAKFEQRPLHQHRYRSVRKAGQRVRIAAQLGQRSGHRPGFPLCAGMTGLHDVGCPHTPIYETKY